MKTYTALIIALLIQLISYNLSALPFIKISKGFAVIEDDNGYSILAAITDFGDNNLYAVTTQSAFFTELSNLKILAFNTERLTVKKVQISMKNDAIRFQIDKNDFITPFKLGKNGKTIYIMNPQTGIIFPKPFSEKKLPPNPGSIVLNQTKLAGLISSLSNFKVQGKATSKLVKLADISDWKDCNFQQFRIQIRQLKKNCDKINSLTILEALHKKNTYIPFSDAICTSLIPWLKNHNQTCENYILTPFKSGKTMGAAKTQHLYRCYYFGEMKSLQSITKNIIQTERIVPWISDYLKGRAKSLSIRAQNIQNSLQIKMNKLVKEHPATKCKL